MLPHIAFNVQRLELARPSRAMRFRRSRAFKLKATISPLAQNLPLFSCSAQFDSLWFAWVEFSSVHSNLVRYSLNTFSHLFANCLTGSRGAARQVFCNVLSEQVKCQSKVFSWSHNCRPLLLPIDISCLILWYSNSFSVFSALSRPTQTQQFYNNNNNNKESTNLRES